MRYASCHASSANTERIFSSLGRIVTPSRNCLNLRTIFDLISIQIYNKTSAYVKAKQKRKSGSRSQRNLSTPSTQSTSAQHSQETLSADETEDIDTHEAPLLDEVILENSSANERFEILEERFKLWIDLERELLAELALPVSPERDERSFHDIAAELMANKDMF